MTVIKIKSSSVAGKTPAADDLQTAELAVNLVDQKLYSKDAGGTVFELGAAGDVPSGDTPPNSGNNVGDLFFDTTTNQLLYWNGSAWEEVGGGSEVLISDTPPPATDLQEGTLWWNSDEDDLQLYVLYNNGTVGSPNFNWIEASPMPGAPIGYPDIEDGDGATLDDRYVNKTGDDMTGDLTLGTDKITLDAADGSATFAGTVTTNAGLYAEGTYHFFRKDSDTETSLVDFYSTYGTVVASSDLVAQLDTEGKLKCDGVIARSSLVSQGDVQVGLGGQTVLNADGSATFAGDTSVGNTHSSGLEGSTFFKTGQANCYRAINIDQKMWVWYSDMGGPKTEKIEFRTDGTINGKNVAIRLEADNPANYTTTTDSEGNETQVYNGPTLDVKESIQTAAAARDAMRETFQELLVAVQSATDFGELKAAMLVALEDYAV